MRGPFCGIRSPGISTGLVFRRCRCFHAPLLHQMDINWWCCQHNLHHDGTFTFTSFCLRIQRHNNTSRLLFPKNVLPQIFDLDLTFFISLSTQVCNTQCTAPDSEYCQPLKSLAVGASDVTTYPDSSATDCGPTFTGDALASLGTESPSDPEHCEAFYITVDTPGAKIADVCGSESCQVQMELANGVKAVAGAAPVPPTPNPKPVVSPSPTPYGRRRNLQQATVTAYGRRM